MFPANSIVLSLVNRCIEINSTAPQSEQLCFSAFVVLGLKVETFRYYTVASV